MLHHYRTTRRDHALRVLKLWQGKLEDEQEERNLTEVLSRADLLIDGIEMLLPDGKLSREATTHVLRAAMLAHGSFVAERQR